MQELRCSAVILRGTVDIKVVYTGITEDAFIVADDYGVSLSYMAPEVTSITPSFGPNVPGQATRITILGSNLGVCSSLD